MAGTTTNYKIPYPTGSDKVGADIFKSLADKVDASLKNESTTLDKKIAAHDSAITDAKGKPMGITEIKSSYFAGSGRFIYYMTRSIVTISFNGAQVAKSASIGGDVVNRIFNSNSVLPPEARPRTQVHGALISTSGIVLRCRVNTTGYIDISNESGKMVANPECLYGQVSYAVF